MIGGTSYSGSTMMELMIANDNHGFSCGEVWSLFMPHKLQHFNPRFPVQDHDPTFWKRILGKGMNQVYSSVCNEMHGLRFLTDNSKVPTWQWHQARTGQARKCEFKYILIWKTPEELAASFHKRKRGGVWAQKWLSYHQQYFTLTKEFRAVKYSDLVSDPQTLKNICRFLEIEYFPEKKDYWNKEHYTLFGNKSAKVHLFDQSTEHFSRVSEKLNQGTGDSVSENHRQVTYKTSDSSAHSSEVARVLSDPRYPKVIEMLEATDINNPSGKRVDFPKLSALQVMKKLLIFYGFRMATRLSLIVFQVTGLKIGRNVANAE